MVEGEEREREREEVAGCNQTGPQGCIESRGWRSVKRERERGRRSGMNLCRPRHCHVIAPLRQGIACQAPLRLTCGPPSLLPLPPPPSLFFFRILSSERKSLGGLCKLHLADQHETLWYIRLSLSLARAKNSSICQTKRRSCGIVCLTDKLILWHAMCTTETLAVSLFAFGTRRVHFQSLEYCFGFTRLKRL